MAEESSFEQLMRRVRAGEQQAAAELIQQYGPYIRRIVRVRLTDARLGRLVDSSDICQSVWASFFVRAAVGDFDLDEPEQLAKLLAQIARNKVADRQRTEARERRDYRRNVEESMAEDQIPSTEPTPGQQIAAQDLLQEVMRRLSPEERELAELRNHGWEWGAIAERLGGTPDALRKKLSRAADRISQEMGLDE